MKTTIGTTAVSTMILTINCNTYDISAVMYFSDSFIQTMSYIDAIPSNIVYFCYSMLPTLNNGIPIEVPSSIDFYYDKLVTKFYPVITCSNSNTLTMPAAYRSPMNLFTHEYLLYMFLYRIFNHPIMQMLFIAFIVYFMQLTSGIANTTRRSRLAFIIIFFNLITKANGSNVSLSRNSLYILLSTVGNFLYLTTSAAYDYFCTKTSMRGKLIINYKFINSTVRNILYSISILCGVYSTNGVWYFSQNIKWSKDLVYLSSVLAPLGSIVCYFAWIKLVTATAREDMDIINSVMRAMVECLGFNFTAFSNYAQWGLWAENVPYYPQISLTLGTAFHLILSYLCITLELYEAHPLAFAVMNYFSFTGAAFSTNAIVEYFSFGNIGFVTNILTSVVLSIITTVLAPPLYRGQRFDIRRATRWQRLLYIARYTLAYYVLVLSFVLATFISFDNAFPL